jgi:hypothetical protein
VGVEEAGSTVMTLALKNTRSASFGLGRSQPAVRARRRGSA